jgi:hypothetical protein
LRDGPQLIQVGIKADGNDTAITHQHGGRLSHHALQGLAMAGSGCRHGVQLRQQGRGFGHPLAQQLGKASRVSRRPASSRGRTWRKAMRAVMRSTSLMLAQGIAQGFIPLVHLLGGQQAGFDGVMAITGRSPSRSGWVIHWRNARLPMPVRQVSSSDNKVGESSPRRVWVNSRLRKVAGGRSSRSLLRGTSSVLTWASALPWVCSA